VEGGGFPVSSQLNFDIGARYREASSAFKQLAGGVDEFQRKLRLLDQTRANPSVDLVIKEAQRKLTELKAELDNLNNVKLQIDADTATAKASISGVERELKRLQDQPASVEVTARTEIARKRLEQLKAELATLKDARLNVTADVSRAKAEIAGLESNLGRLERQRTATLAVEADTESAERQVGAFAALMRARLVAATKALPEIELTADSSDVDREMAAVRAQLQTLLDPTITPDLADARIRTEIAALQSRLQLLAAQDVTIDARFNATSALAEFALLRRAMASVDRDGNSLRRTTGALGTAFGVLAGGVGVALSGLGAAVSVVGSLTGLGTQAGSAMTSLGASIAKSGGQVTGSLTSLVSSAAAAAAQLAVTGAVLVGIGSLIAGAASIAVAGIGQLGGAVIALASGIVPLTGLLGTLPGLLIPVGIAVGTLAIAFGDEGLKKELENTKKAFEPLVADIRNQLRPALTELLGAVNGLVPVFQRVAPVITGALSDVASGFSNILKSSTFKSDLEELMRSSGATIRGLGTAFQLVFLGLTDMAIAAQPAVDSLVGLIQEGALAFQQFMAEGRRTGELATFFQQGVTVLRQVLEVVGNLSGLFKDLWDSANRTGAFQATLGAINDGITRFRDYVDDAGGAWDRLMAKAGPVTAAIVRLVESIGKAFVDMGANVDIIPLLDKISSAITNMTPTFVDIANKAVPAFERIIGVIERVVIAVGPDIAENFEGLATAFERMEPSLKGIIPFLGDLVVGIGNAIAVAGTLADNLITLAGIGQKILAGDIKGALLDWTALQVRTRAASEAFNQVPGAANAAAGAVRGVGEAVEEVPPGKDVIISLDTSSMNADTQAAITYINSVPQNWFTRFAGDMINLGAVAVMAQTETGKVPDRRVTTFTGDISQLSPQAATAVAQINAAPQTWLTMFGGDVIDIMSKAGTATGSINAVPGDHPTAFNGDPGGAVAAAGSATGAINGVPDRSDTAINAQDNTSSVVRDVWNALNGLNGHVVTTFIDTVRRFFGDGGMIMTDGAVAMAPGGTLGHNNAANRMQPMSGRTARIVPPRTLRVIGDRMTDDEAFIPINDSPWSTAILGETARRKGFALVPLAGADVMPMSRGGINLRDERAWEWIQKLLERFRGGAPGGGGGGIPTVPGGVGGPAGPAPVGRLPQATLRTMFHTAGGMASMTRANPLYAPMPLHGQKTQAGGAVKVDMSNLSFRLTGNRFMDNLLEEIANSIRSRGGDPQIVFGRR